MAVGWASGGESGGAGSVQKETREGAIVGGQLEKPTPFFPSFSSLTPLPWPGTSKPTHASRPAGQQQQQQQQLRTGSSQTREGGSSVPAFLLLSLSFPSSRFRSCFLCRLIRKNDCERFPCFLFQNNKNSLLSPCIKNPLPRTATLDPEANFPSL